MWATRRIFEGGQINPASSELGLSHGYFRFCARLGKAQLSRECEMPKGLDLHYDFSELSIRDLLEARDLYHFHLMSKANVVGTAIGYYLIRKEEEWPRRGKPSRKLTTPRTLANSEVRNYSWPAVLVLVDQWLNENAFSEDGREH